MYRWSETVLAPRAPKGAAYVRRAGCPRSRGLDDDELDRGGRVRRTRAVDELIIDHGDSGFGCGDREDTRRRWSDEGRPRSCGHVQNHQRRRRLAEGAGNKFVVHHTVGEYLSDDDREAVIEGSRRDGRRRGR